MFKTCTKTLSKVNTLKQENKKYMNTKDPPKIRIVKAFLLKWINMNLDLVVITILATMLKITQKIFSLISLFQEKKIMTI